MILTVVQTLNVGDLMTIIHSDLSFRIIGAAIEVHRTVGPGLVESMYQRCLEHELTLQGIEFESEVPVPLEYKGLQLEGAYRADLVVERSIILELKSVDELLPVHEAQLLTYMKLVGVSVGYLLNFNVPNLTRHGCERFVL